LCRTIDEAGAVLEAQDEEDGSGDDRYGDDDAPDRVAPAPRSERRQYYEGRCQCDLEDQVSHGFRWSRSAIFPRRRARRRRGELALRWWEE
jgi:hypothetical protein